MTQKRLRSRVARSLRRSLRVDFITSQRLARLVIKDRTIDFIDALRDLGYVVDTVVLDTCPHDDGWVGYYSVYQNDQYLHNFPFNCCGLQVISK